VSAKAFSSCSTGPNHPIALFGAEQENHKSLEKLGSSLNLETSLRNSPLPHLEALSTNSLKLLEIKEYSSLQGAEPPEVYECISLSLSFKAVSTREVFHPSLSQKPPLKFFQVFR